MPHTCTKNFRPKRLDNRPCAKARKATNKNAADAMTAQELKVTKKRRRDQGEREVQRGEMKKEKTAESKIEKKVMEMVRSRVENHEMRNLARKLTPAERKAKKALKLAGEDTSTQVGHSITQSLRN